MGSVCPVTITQLCRRAFCVGLFAPLCLLAEDKKPTLILLGDSITAGYGVEQPQAYPALLQQKIREAGLPFEVVNAGLSGDTTAGGLRRLDWLLQRPVDLLVIALGGNDGLRGIPPETTTANLQAIIDKVKTRQPQARIALAGMRLPPNLGADYTARFEKIYPALAQKNGVLLIPFLLEGVGGNHELNQPDQIHPNAAGHKVIAELMWEKLQPLLRSTAP